MLRLRESEIFYQNSATPIQLGQLLLVTTIRKSLLNGIGSVRKYRKSISLSKLRMLSGNSIHDNRG